MDRFKELITKFRVRSMALERRSFHMRNDMTSYYNSFPLHKAIVENSLLDLETLLHKPDIDINLQDELGQTPLLLSLKRKQSSNFILRLIRAGCNVNISDITKATPLHLAISASLNDVACELIKRGANVNVQEEHIWNRRSCIVVVGVLEEHKFNKKTPLHHAVQYNNLEGVSMLLYYGADVYLRSSNDMTPLKYAACKKFDKIVKILINYYDESYYKCESVRDFFCHPPHSLNLEHEITVLLVYSLECQNEELFKLFWNRINFQHILNNQDLNFLLATFIEHSCFSTSYWLKHLYLILNIFFTRQFTISYNNCSFQWVYNETFFYRIFNAFHKKNIKLTNRLAIMNVCLSLGAPIHLADFEEVHKRYGFNEELETLIYAHNYKENDREIRLRSITPFILAMEENVDNKLLCELFKSYFRKVSFRSFASYQIRVPLDYFSNLMKYFSLSPDAKKDIKELCKKYPQILEKLEEVCEFPTLLELSRHQARKYIKQSNNVKYAYQFHDAVKKLNLPNLIKDIIRFRVPLY